MRVAHANALARGTGLDRAPTQPCQWTRASGRPKAYRPSEGPAGDVMTLYFTGWASCVAEQTTSPRACRSTSDRHTNSPKCMRSNEFCQRCGIRTERGEINAEAILF